MPAGLIWAHMILVREAPNNLLGRQHLTSQQLLRNS